jgi:hypothetical protein
MKNSKERILHDLTPFQMPLNMSAGPIGVQTKSVGPDFMLSHRESVIAGPSPSLDLSLPTLNSW